ncbi:MAG: peptide chain release factor N(5)-glutamine methyltransferase [Endomicrobia bacterium]|nr:peptide chain release factor N(5)-glutamine methyltransferase [Endomicrobiia bacterium]
MITLKELYNEVYTRFFQSNFDLPHIETEIILTKTLNIPKIYIYLYPDLYLTNNEIEKVTYNLQLRLQHKPIAYIFNEQEFFGYTFYVDENVLIPRAETELVVEEAIKLITKNNIKICADIGTGSGNIAISIAKNITTNISIFAIDYSQSALTIAKKNAKMHNVEDKIKFILCDKLQYFINNNLKLDLIISNPPYISYEEYKNLQPEIYYEPKQALVVATGMEFYKYFAQYGKHVLKPGGFIVLEMNSNLYNKISQLFINFEYKIEQIIYDYYKLPRCIVLKN